MSKTNRPRDISTEDLARMQAKSEHPAELSLLVDTARKQLGFFPAHNPRAIEYPWVLANMPADLKGVKILDVGAGLNPLPLVLAERGGIVTTLDSHPTVRTLKDRAKWNEWGFLDYRLLDPRIRSIHKPFEQWTADVTFSVIYCVSVIEHLPASVRRRWITQFASQLVGALLLTVDLIAGSELLWNRSEGQLVENETEHGSLEMMYSELRNAGIQAEPPIIKRDISGSIIDIALIRGRH